MLRDTSGRSIPTNVLNADNVKLIASSPLLLQNVHMLLKCAVIATSVVDSCDRVSRQSVQALRTSCVRPGLLKEGLLKNPISSIQLTRSFVMVVQNV